jgi:hypothetical protein
MAGVIWRQHRFTLAGVAVLVGALAVYEWLTGETLHHAWAAAVGCHPAGAAACQGPVNTFNYLENFVSLGGPLQLVPPLIGAFAGAPLLAREMETGTFRFAWTQGFGRWRWALAKLTGLAVVLAAVVGTFGILVSWHYQPWFAAGNQGLGLTSLSPFYTGLFDLRGLALPAWTLAAFAIGALAGMIVRRVVPAIVATLAVYAGLAFAAARFLRWHYLAPLVTRNPSLPGSAWILSQYSTRDGRFAFAGFPPGNLLDRYCSSVPPGKGGPTTAAFTQCLARHGYTQWTSYQPASRFWVFQWIEAGWLLVLSAVLIAVTIWLVRRRAA